MRVLSSLLVVIGCCWLHVTPAWTAGPRDDLQAYVQGALARIDGELDALLVEHGHGSVSEIVGAIRFSE